MQSEVSRIRQEVSRKKPEVNMEQQEVGRMQSEVSRKQQEVKEEEEHAHLLQVVQGAVDELGLCQQLPVKARLADPVRPGQVHQVKFRAPYSG